jgi:hypothetical protein
MSRRLPCAVHMHKARTSRFVGSVARRVRHGPEPPPPSTGVFRAFLRMHRPLTSMFGRRLLCLWGQFVGTYSALAYAAYAGWRWTRAGCTLRFRGRGADRAKRCMRIPSACLCSCPTHGIRWPSPRTAGALDASRRGFDGPEAGGGGPSLSCSGTARHTDERRRGVKQPRRRRGPSAARRRLRVSDAARCRMERWGRRELPCSTRTASTASSRASG